MWSYKCARAHPYRLPAADSQRGRNAARQTQCTQKVRPSLTVRRQVRVKHYRAAHTRLTASACACGKPAKPIRSIRILT
jgi:hypothetical protein